METITTQSSSSSSSQDHGGSSEQPPNYVPDDYVAPKPTRRKHGSVTRDISEVQSNLKQAIESFESSCVESYTGVKGNQNSNLVELASPDLPPPATSDGVAHITQIDDQINELRDRTTDLLRELEKLYSRKKVISNW